MHWIFGVKFVNLGDSCTVGGDRAMNIIIARVPVLNVSEYFNYVFFGGGGGIHNFRGIKVGKCSSTLFVIIILDYRIRSN